MVAPLNIFCCYAREDRVLMENLRKHLKPLQRRGFITIWSDMDINAGDAWEDEIKRHLDSANIILLLVSPDFMDSDYCYSTEMERALERHTKKEARVIPIIMRPTNWKGAPFDTLQVLPTNAKPVTDRRSWLTEDEALNDVSEHFSTIVANLLKDQWLAEGDIHYKADRYLEALSCAEQACKLDPTYARAYNRKGNALYRLNRYAEALAAQMKAIEYDSTYGEAYNGKGHALLALNLPEEALEAYESAIQLDSGYSYIWYEKGNVLYKLERYEEALEAYNEAIRRPPSYVKAYVGKGNTLRRLKNYEEALIAFQQASELQPNNAGYLDTVGTALRDLKRYEEALTTYDKAIELDSNSIDPYIHKGRVFLDLERYEEALNVYKRAIEVAPDNTWTWHDKGLVLYYLEQDEEALEAFNKALEIAPNNMWAWHQKGVALERLAQQAHAKAEKFGYREVVEEKASETLKAPPPKLNKSTLVKMPRLGENVAEGTIGSWLKEEGEWIEKDDSLAEIITDKINAELPSPVAGRLAKILVQVDKTVPVGADIAIIEEL